MAFLQVASWNIEHLSGASRANKAQTAFALADHIEMAGVDLIVLQEIYVTPNDEEVRLFEDQPVIDSRTEGERRNADLDRVCYLLEEHLDDPWAYHILPNKNLGDKSQLCAVLWNTKRLTLEHVIPLDVPDRVDVLSVWDRRPHLLSFTSDILVWRKSEEGQWKQLEERRRLSVVPLHMKSNYGGVTKNRRVRENEAKTLCTALASIRGDFDPSLILIGDTNILNNMEPAVDCFIDNGFVDLNNNDGTTYWSSSYGESPFDRAFVATERPEFRYTRQYIMRSSDLDAHDHYLSDHYMIKISVKDYVDDTDPR